MAITSYIGLPGSGKSYGVVENVIIPTLKKGRPVYTNVVLNHDEIIADIPDAQVYALDDREIKDDLSKLCEIEGGAVIVLDEAWRFWPQGLKWDRLTEDQQSFFTEHRHKSGADGYTQEIVLIVQCTSLLAAGVRRLIDTTYICQKLDKIGAKGRFSVTVYQGSQSIERPNQSRKVNELLGKYKPEIYKYYKSQTKAKEGLGHAMEEVADSRAVIWKNPLVQAGAVAAVVFGGWGIWFLLNYFSPEAEIERDLAEPIPIEQMTAPKPDNVTDLLPTQSTMYSDRWRLVGFIDIEAGKHSRRYFIVEGEQGRRRVPWANCRSDRLGGHECLVDGQTVTDWTGPKPSIGERFTGNTIGQLARVPQA